MTIKRPKPGTKRARQRRERRDEFADHTPRPVKRAVGRSTSTQTPLHIRAMGFVLNDDVRAYVRQRVAFKLGKFALEINRVSVRFEILTGASKRALYECRLKVVLRSGEDKVFSARGADPRGAFDALSDVAARWVRKELDKRRTSRLRPPRTAPRNSVAR